MLLETLYQPWRKARSTNQTSSSFANHAATLTTPAGDANTATGQAVLELGANTNLTQNALMVLPYGVGADDATFSFQVIGWAPSVVANSNGVFTWFPTLLAEVACTLSDQQVGVATGYVVATEYFCKTLAVTYGNSNVSVEIVVTADGRIAHALVDLKGHQKVEVRFSTGSSATSCNALCRFL